MNIQTHWQGLTSYGEALELQKTQALEVSELGQGRLLGLHHPAVLTLGVRGDENKDILLDSSIEIFKIRRGGEATIHNPGQLIIYPILPIKRWGIGVRDFVEKLMLTTENFFLSHGVKVFRKQEPGLYTEKGKIAFFGIQVSRGITRHGLAININNDLEVFKNISVCGVQNEKLDRLENYNKINDLELLFQQWCEIFNSHNS